MKINNIITVTLLLMVILTIGTVSAEGDTVSDELTVAEDINIESAEEDINIESAEEDINIKDELPTIEERKLSDPSEDISQGEDINLTVEIEPFMTQNDHLWISVPFEASGPLSVLVDNDEIYYEDNFWFGYIPLNISFGNHDLEVRYLGSEYFGTHYNPVNYTCSFTYSYVKVYADYEGIIIDSEEEMNAKLYLDGNLIYSGKIDYTLIENTTNLFSGYIPNYTLITNGKGKYNPITINGTLDYLIEPKIEIPKMMIGGEDKYLTIELPKDASGNLTVYINDTEINASLKNGKAIISLKTLGTGNYRINVTYNSDKKYDDYMNWEDIKIIENPDFKIKASGKIIQNTKSKVIFTGPDDLEGNIEVKIGSKTYKASYKNGTATLTFIPTAAGANKKFTFVFSEGISGTFKVNVYLKKPTIKAANFNVNYPSKTNYKVQIFNGVSNEGNKKVTFTLYKNKKKIAAKTVKTDKNGYAKVYFDVAPGNYNVQIKCDSSSLSKKYTIEPIKIYFKKYNNKNKKLNKDYYGMIGGFNKKISISFYLKTASGQYLKAKTVKFTIKGKTYSAKTNKKGVVTFTLKKSLLKEAYTGDGQNHFKISYLKDVHKGFFSFFSKKLFKTLDYSYKYYIDWGGGSLD